MPTSGWDQVIVGVGSNLGDTRHNLEEALRRFDGPRTRWLRRGRVFRSPAIGPGLQPDYLNTAIEVETSLAPCDLLAWLKQIEWSMGRTPGVRWGPRVIDLDILLWGKNRLVVDPLRIPHPGLGDRRFVLEPLSDLGPERWVPGLEQTVGELCLRRRHEGPPLVVVDAAVLDRASSEATSSVVDLARTLVAMPSVTGDEGRLCAWVAEALDQEGWDVVTQVVPPEGEEASPALVSASASPSRISGRGADVPRLNILARSGPGDLRLVFTTHLDTVPPFIPPTEDDTWLYGRGTCDAKGIFAAQWVAARRLRARGVGGIGLLALVGEETTSMGAKCAHAFFAGARWIINGEPTELMLASGAKGVLALRLEARGIAAHSAYPERGCSATDALVDVLHALTHTPLPFHDAFGPTTVNVGLLEGGVAPNVVAPHARAVVMIRLGAPSFEVEAAVRAIVRDRVDIDVLSRAEPHPIHVPEGYESALVRFGSDIPHLARLGTPLLVGPGSIHDAHTAHEKVAKSDLERAADLYVELALALIGDGRPA